MKFSFASLLATAAFAYGMLSPLPVSAADDKEIEAVVKKYITEHPEVIIKAVQDYQEKMAAEHISEAAQNLVRMQDKIARDPRSPFIGNPNGDVTITEFFDYHCGYCKRFFPELAQLLREDKHVRVVFKEFPILNPDSETAAKAALAVYNIDKSKYFDYHIRLMQSRNDFTDEVLTSAAVQEGINADEFHKALSDPQLQKDIDNNKALAKDLAITGTPGIIVGTEFMPGAISYDALKATVSEVRDNQSLRKGSEKRDD